MALKSINPATNEVLFERAELTLEELNQKLDSAHETWKSWRQTSLDERAALLRRVGTLCKERAPELGRLAALEMGKTITAAIAEVEKCALACEYYAAEAEKILAPEVIASDASKSYVRFDSLGVILAVMPWNFPFWQVMRFAAPALMAGNVGVLKHASNVPQCAAAFEDLFTDAGFPAGVFQNLPIGSGLVESVLKHPAVKGVALTGSEFAGRAVASQAGRELKKSVMELGGSDPFIVLADADIAEAAQVAAKARLQNNGQSCIAAKRFIVVEEVYDAFLSAFINTMNSAVIGDQLDPATTLGPLVNPQAVEEIERQIKESVAKGAHVATGGNRIGDKGNFFAPTVLTDVVPGMPAYHEELFGPVASVIKAKDAEDAIRIANDTDFGLGSSIWTADIVAAEKAAERLHTGSVFINGMVKSDPRLPFGGIGISGYGRELAGYGLKEFVNIKTVWVK